MMFMQSKKRDVPAAHEGGVIVLAALLTHGHVLWGGWVRDDYALIVDNPAVRTLASIPAQLTQPFLGIFWRPSVTIAYTLEYAAWGLRPVGFHATNVLLHCAAALLVAALWRRFADDARVALGAGVVFALHGAHYQPAVIADRTGLMATTFSLCAWWCCLRGTERKAAGGGALGWFAAAVVAYVVALGAKEEAVVLPVLVVVVAMLRSRDAPRAALVKLAPVAGVFVAIAVAYLIVRGRVLGGGGLVSTAWPALGARIVSLPAWLVHHWRDAVLPLWLDFDYRGLVWPHLGVGAIVVGLVVIVAAGAVAWRLRDARPEMLIGLVWAVLAWLPASNLVPVYPETAASHVFMPPHFLYFPNAALAGALAAGGVGLLERARPAGSVACAAFLLLHGVMAVRMNYVWMDDVRLYRYVLEMHPHHPLMWRNLGLALAQRGQMAEAAAAYERSIDAQPSAEGHLGYGLVQQQLGAADAAREAFESCMRLEPTKPACYVALARWHAARGDIERALAVLERGIIAGADASELREEREHLTADEPGFVYDSAGQAPINADR